MVGTVAALCWGGGFLIGGARHSDPSTLAAVSGLRRDRRLRPGAGLRLAGQHADPLVPRSSRHGGRHGHHGLRRRRDHRLAAEGVPDSSPSIEPPAYLGTVEDVKLDHGGRPALRRSSTDSSAKWSSSAPSEVGAHDRHGRARRLCRRHGRRGRRGDVLRSRRRLLRGDARSRRFRIALPAPGWKPTGWTPPPAEQTRRKMISTHHVGIDEAVEDAAVLPVVDRAVLQCHRRHRRARRRQGHDARHLRHDAADASSPARFAATFVLMISVFNMAGPLLLGQRLGLPRPAAHLHDLLRAGHGAVPVDPVHRLQQAARSRRRLAGALLRGDDAHLHDVRRRLRDDPGVPGRSVRHASSSAAFTAGC